MKKENFKNVTSKIETVGINLSLIFSLIKILENGLLDEFNISKIDTSNLVILLKRLMTIVIEDYSEIEDFIDS